MQIENVEDIKNNDQKVQNIKSKLSWIDYETKKKILSQLFVEGNIQENIDLEKITEKKVNQIFDVLLTESEIERQEKIDKYKKEEIEEEKKYHNKLENLLYETKKFDIKIKELIQSEKDLDDAEKLILDM